MTHREFIAEINYVRTNIGRTLDNREDGDKKGGFCKINPGKCSKVLEHLLTKEPQATTTTTTTETRLPAILKFEKLLDKICSDESPVLFNGKFSIKSEKMPTAAEMLSLAEEAKDMRKAVEEMESISMWIMASMLDLYATSFEVGNVFSGNKKEDALYKSALKTFQMFGGKRFKLSWDHHKELAHMRSLSPRLKEILGEYAEKHDSSISEMRIIARKMQQEIKTKGLPASEKGNQGILNRAAS